MLTVVVVLLLASAFYWFQYRPQSIKRACHDVGVKHAEEVGYSQSKVYNFQYSACLHKNGL